MPGPSSPNEPPSDAGSYDASGSPPPDTWRNATPADDDAIVEMCLALNAEDPGEPVAETQIRRTLAELRAHPVRGKAVLAADDDGHVPSDVRRIEAFIEPGLRPRRCGDARTIRRASAPTGRPWRGRMAGACVPDHDTSNPAVARVPATAH